ncbi:MAG: phosphatidate cytidylyltransferase [Micropepsaceae bacterium]
MILSEAILAILIPVAGLFLLGALIIVVAGRTSVGRNAASELWAVYRSEFLIVGVLLVPAALGGWAFTIFLVALAWRGQVELGKLFELRVSNVVTVIAMGVAGLTIAAPWFGSVEYIPALMLIGASAMLVVGVVAPAGSKRLSLLGASAVGLIFPVLCCVIAALLRLGPEGLAWIFVVYATVEINDTSAFLVGKLAGAHSAFPKLSPEKTLEGLAAGITVGGPAGTLLAHRFLELPFISAFMLAVLLLAAGIGGDLATSALKRRRGKKDFSPVLRRHGGVLDIYDAFLFAVPIALFFRWAVAG